MQKIWFFVEGDSEMHLIEAMIHRNYPDVILEKDELKFISEEYKRHCCYCVNAGSVDKLPFLIRDYAMDRRIERSQSNDVVVICDIENLKCNSSRRNKIESPFDALSKRLNIKYIFFNPMIEALYWDCPENINRVLLATYRKKYNTDVGIIKNENIQAVSKQYHYHLQELFKQNNLKYRENKFSKEFFNRVDYKHCDNLIIRRLIDHMNDKLGGIQDIY